MKNVIVLCMCTLLTFGAVFSSGWNKSAADASKPAPDFSNLSQSFALAAADRATLETERENLAAELAQAKRDGIDKSELWDRMVELNEQLDGASFRDLSDIHRNLDEGGESCTSGTVITTVPYADLGNTCDNTDDVDFICGAPGGKDVVYVFVPPVSGEYTVSTCHPGTDFDTGLSIWDGAANFIACNDDYGLPGCRLSNGLFHKSTIPCVYLEANETYCIVVDGFSAENCGNYEFTLSECECAVCPDGAVRSVEPVCDIWEFVDVTNGGCYTDFPPDRSITYYEDISCGMTICGTSGESQDTITGEFFYDEDWYRFVLTDTLQVSICLEGENQGTFAIFEGPCPVSGDPDYYRYSDPCEAECFIECLLPGEYFIAVTMDGECGTHYNLSLDCSECPCYDGVAYQYISTQGGLPACQCITIECPTQIICVGPLGPDEMPADGGYTVFEGCRGSGAGAAIPSDPCFEECDPAYLFQFSDWYYDEAQSAWCAAFGATNPGCACFCLDRILPVELNSFDAVAGDAEVRLNWSTASETDNDHFDIVRDGTIVAQINAQNSATGNHYSWTEHDLNNGREYTYTLIAVSLNGTREEMATASATPTVTAATITEYALHQNYPNPFNPETNISFDLVEAGSVSLTVYNPLGQTVATLVNGSMESGRHSVNFQAADLPSGLYFYRLDASDFHAVKKMILMK